MVRTKDVYNPNPAMAPIVALSTDRRYFNRLAIPHYSEQREHAVVREVDVVNFISHFKNHCALRERNISKVFDKRIEVRTRQRREQLILQGSG